VDAALLQLIAVKIATFSGSVSKYRYLWVGSTKKKARDSKAALDVFRSFVFPRRIADVLAVDLA